MEKFGVFLPISQPLYSGFFSLEYFFLVTFLIPLLREVTLCVNGFLGDVPLNPVVVYQCHLILQGLFILKNIAKYLLFPGMKPSF